jgi:hypothetical protein
MTTPKPNFAMEATHRALRKAGAWWTKTVILRVDDPVNGRRMRITLLCALFHTKVSDHNNLKPILPRGSNCL